MKIIKRLISNISTIMRPKVELKQQSQRVKTFHFVLTEFCNMNCSYCNVDKSNKHTETFESFLNYYNKHVKGCTNYYFDIFGGEPLIQAEICLSIVEFLEKDIYCKNIRLTTNGSIFNDTIKKIIVSQKTQITISHDGLYQSKYRSNVNGRFNDILFYIHQSGKPLKLHLMIHDKLFITSNDNILIDQHNYLKHRFGKNVNIQFEIVRDKQQWTKQSADNYINAYKNYVLFICEMVNRDEYLSFNDIDILYTSYASALIEKSLTKDYKRNTCGVDDGSYTTFFKGQIIPCERFARDDYSLERLNDKKFMTNLYKHCESCSINDLCNKGCIYENVSNGELITEVCYITIESYKIVQQSFIICGKKLIALFTNNSI